MKKQNFDEANMQGAVGMGGCENARQPNQIDLLHMQIQKLQAVIQEQEQELLRMYRKLNDRY